MRTSPIGLLSALVVSVGLVALPGAGRADTQTFQFTSDHCTNGCLTGQTSGGSVTVSEVGAGVLSFAVNLLNGNQFINSGFEASFGFNLVGDPTIAYSNITPGSFTIPGTLDPSQAAGSLHMDGTGTFDYGLEATGNGGSDPNGTSLTFLITAAGLTLASLQANAIGQFFAADIISGTTGWTGGIDASLSSVPLPPAALLFGTALVGMGVLGRRRRKDALAA